MNSTSQSLWPWTRAPSSESKCCQMQYWNINGIQRTPLIFQPWGLLKVLQPSNNLSKDSSTLAQWVLMKSCIKMDKSQGNAYSHHPGKEIKLLLWYKHMHFSKLESIFFHYILFFFSTIWNIKLETCRDCLLLLTNGNEHNILLKIHKSPLTKTGSQNNNTLHVSKLQHKACQDMAQKPWIHESRTLQ